MCGGGGESTKPNVYHQHQPSDFSSQMGCRWNRIHPHLGIEDTAPMEFMVLPYLQMNIQNVHCENTLVVFTLYGMDSAATIFYWIELSTRNFLFYVVHFSTVIFTPK